MRFKSEGKTKVNVTQRDVTASLTGRGRPIDETVARVLAATRAMAERDPRCKDWDWAEEEHGIRVLCYRFVNKVMRENGEDLGHTLPDKLYGAWNRIIAQRDIPEIFHNRVGAAVRPNKRNRAENVSPNDTSTDDSAPEQETSKQEPKSRFKIAPSWELQPGTTEQPYLIDELIPAKGIVLLWGPPKCLKSFKVLDMMWHVANQWEYRDRAVRGGLVMYCAFEGSHGYTKRIEAIRRFHRQTPADRTPLYVMSGRTDLIRDHDVLVREIRNYLEGKHPVAVVLDTLNKSLVGSENKDVDMAAYIRAAEAVRDAFDCVVIIVHHCGWDETRMRGHSSLRGAVDAELAVSRENDVVTLTVETMRDGPDEVEIVSKSIVMDVGYDAGGRPLTSLALEPWELDGGAAPGKAGSRWPKSLKVFHEAIVEATTSAAIDLKIENGPTVRAVDLEDVRKAFYTLYVAVSVTDTTPEYRQDAKRKAFTRAVELARNRSLIGARSYDSGKQVIWLVR
jgi:hypothetical protein